MYSPEAHLVFDLEASNQTSEEIFGTVFGGDLQEASSRHLVLLPRCAYILNRVTLREIICALIYLNVASVSPS